MKIESSVCDLCPKNAQQAASVQIKFRDLQRKITRGRPAQEDLLDLCVDHHHSLTQWLSMVEKGDQ